MRKFGIFIIMIIIPIHLVMGQGYINTVVIDPGHGGGDPGAVGSIYKEKDIVLDISLKLGEYIENEFDDVTVIYTRKTDKFIELWKRTEIANKNQADLFISVHCNAAGARSAYGFETFVMGLHESEKNLKVAKQENAAVLLEDNHQQQYDGFNPNSPEAYIIFSLYQNTFLHQSLEFAEKIQYQFRERVKRHDRGVKQAGFLVLYGTTMPAVLVEAGFLSNPAEEKFLGSEQGQSYISSAIFRAFKDYKTRMEADLEEQDSRKEDTTLQLTATNQPDKIQDTTKTTDNRDIKTQHEQEEIEPSTQENEVIFAVQFLISSEKKVIDSKKAPKGEKVNRYFHNGMHKYYVGSEPSLNNAVILQHEVQKQGYEDAFVIAFYKGERISLKEASRRIAE
ncbi:MAG: N-acetylmuramoyl-L-alanine amidase [Bacteroidales bacterium]